MNEMMIDKIIFGTMLSIGAAVLFFITFKLWFKYLIQEKRCVKETDGVIKKYTLASRGPDGSGVHLPIVSYSVEGKDYTVVGPEYRVISLVNRASVSNENDMNYREEGQSLHIYRHSNSIVGIYKNPIQEMYPIRSRVKVFYDPNRPKLAYVKRYCDRKFYFWLGFAGAGSCLIIDILLLLLM